MSQPLKKLLEPIILFRSNSVESEWSDWELVHTRSFPGHPRMYLLGSESSIEHFDIESMSHSP